jgi:hypothetical protein
MKTYKFNLIFHFLTLIESPLNFILSIFGSTKFVRLSEWYILQTEFKRIVEEYQSAVDNKLKMHNDSINAVKKLKFSDMQDE